MAEGTALKSHISEYTVLLNDMEMIGIKTVDEDKTMILLCSLPNSYKGFKETILHSRDYLTFKDVKNNLLIKFDIDLDSNKATNHENVGLFIERGREKKRN
jgi:gag-polypeptide of LTR copia-type